MKLGPLFLIMAVLGAAPALAETPPAEQLADAERAFAAEAAKSGWIAAFKLYSAPDGVVFQPDPINAKESLEKTPADADSKELKWWPIFAGISSSGDLGYTTGPYTVGASGFGHYFTVWRKQADGSWKWIFDGGPRTKELSPHGPETPTSYLPISSAGSGSADAAKTEVTALEAALAAAAKNDTKAAYLAHLSDDARVMGSPAQPATTKETHETELASRSASLDLSRIGIESSEAGDLVFTYGDAKWTKDGTARRGHYVRIWQKRDDGWKLVFDEILAVPVPAG
jgi:ketosteroid isomerase-like protein